MISAFTDAFMKTGKPSFEWGGLKIPAANRILNFFLTSLQNLNLNQTEKIDLFKAFVILFSDLFYVKPSADDEKEQTKLQRKLSPIDKRRTAIMKALNGLKINLKPTEYDEICNKVTRDSQLWNSLKLTSLEILEKPRYQFKPQFRTITTTEAVFRHFFKGSTVPNWFPRFILSHADGYLGVARTAIERVIKRFESTPPSSIKLAVSGGNSSFTYVFRLVEDLLEAKINLNNIDFEIYTAGDRAFLSELEERIDNAWILNSILKQQRLKSRYVSFEKARAQQKNDQDNKLHLDVLYCGIGSFETRNNTSFKEYLEDRNISGWDFEICDEIFFITEPKDKETQKKLQEYFTNIFRHNEVGAKRKILLCNGAEKAKPLRSFLSYLSRRQDSYTLQKQNIVTHVILDTELLRALLRMSHLAGG